MVTVTYKRRGRRTATTSAQRADQPVHRTNPTAPSTNTARNPYGTTPQLNQALAQMQAELDALRTPRPAKHVNKTSDVK